MKYDMARFEYVVAKKWLAVAAAFPANASNDQRFEELFDRFRMAVENAGLKINEAKAITKPLNTVFALGYEMGQDPEYARGIRQDGKAAGKLDRLNAAALEVIRCGARVIAADIAAAEMAAGSRGDEALECVRELGLVIDEAAWSRANEEVVEVRGRRLALAKDKAVEELVSKYISKMMFSARATLRSQQQAANDLVVAISDRLEACEEEIREAETEREHEASERELALKREALDATVTEFQTYRESVDFQRDQLVESLMSDSYRVAYIVGALPHLNFGPTVSVIGLNQLAEQAPSGGPILVFALTEVDVSSARAFGALVVAGREVQMVAAGGVASDARPWLTSSVIERVFEIDGYSLAEMPNWVTRLIEDKVSPGLVFVIAVLGRALMPQEFEVVKVDAVEHAGPSGVPLVLYAASSVTIEQARLIASLSAAGRPLSLASAEPIDTVVRDWIPADVTTSLIPNVRFEEFVGTVSGGIEVDRILREDNEAYIAWSQKLFENCSDAGGRMSFDAIDTFASDLPSEYAASSRDGFGDPTRNVIIPFQLVGEAMAMEFLEADQDEIEAELREWVENLMEQGGVSFNGAELFASNSAALLDVTTPFGAKGIIRISRNWSFDEDEMMTRIGFCLGYVTDERIFSLEDPNLQAAVWPMRAGLERSWPLPLDKRIFFDGPHSLFVGSMGASEKFEMSRWMSVELAPTDGAGTFCQWWGDVDVPIGHGADGRRPLAVWIGFELLDSDTLSSVFMNINSLLVMVKAIDAVHINPRILDELGLLPYALPRAVTDEPLFPLQGTSFLASESPVGNSTSSSSGLGSSSNKIGR
jgi:hypothetical protein